MKEKITSFLEKKFLPVAGKIASNIYLNAIKDGFIFATPFLIVGSFALLIFNLPFTDKNNFLYMKAYVDFVAKFQGNYIQIFNVSMAIMSVFVSFGIGYSMSGYYNMDKLTGGALSLYSFLLVSAKSISVTISGVALTLLYIPEGASIPVLDARYLDAKGLFVAIIFSLLSIEIFKFLVSKKLTIKLPDSVPPAIIKSFEILVPIAVVSVLYQTINVIVQENLLVMLPDLIMKTIQPILNLSDGLASIIIIIIITQILWFAGIHGANILNTVVIPITLTNLAINQAALSAGENIPKVFTGGFLYCFVYLGGSGATLALCIAMLMVKNAHLKSIGKLAIVPGMFNINEPVLFGVPIVMNPIFVIPFILTPIVNAIITYMFMEFGIVAKVVALVPWTTPPVLGGFLASNLSVTAAVLVIALVVLDYFIYKPFLNMYIKELEKK